MKLTELTEVSDFGYKLFFMNGLHQHGAYFRITPDDERSEAFPTKSTPDSFTLGLLTDSDELTGIVSFQRDGQNRRKMQHKGLLFRMYVAAGHSGQGLGRWLLEETIRRVREQTNIEQINLTVAATNITAKRQYEKIGFRSFALERNALKVGDTYYDEEQMVLFLNR